MYGFIGVTVIVAVVLMVDCAWAKTQFQPCTVCGGPAKERLDMPLEKISTTGPTVTVFWDLHKACPQCEGTIRDIDRFKKDHPWLVLEVVLVADTFEFNRFTHSRIFQLPTDLTYQWDVDGSKQNGRDLLGAMTFVVKQDGEERILEGNVDHLLFVVDHVRR